MLRTVLAVSFIVIASAAGAQTDPTACQAMAGPSGGAADNSRAYLRSMESLSMKSASLHLKGKELASANAMLEARDAALEPFREFVNKMEDFAYEMRRCAR